MAALPRIFFSANLNDFKLEGYMKIVSQIKDHLKKNFQIVENQYDTVMIHSAGFFDALRFLNETKWKVYCMHSSAKLDLVKEVYDFYQLFTCAISFRTDVYGISKRGYLTSMRLISAVIPLWFKKCILRKMNVVIVPSKYIFDEIKLDNARIIHHGVDLSKFVRREGKNKKKTIGYIGHSSPNKGIIEAIQSFSRINGVRKVVYLSNVNNKIRAYIQRVDANIEVRGIAKDIVKAYGEIDVLVLPYRHSASAIGTPLVLLEGMACKCVVVTSDLPHLREICGNTVVYTQPYNVESIVLGIRKALNEEGVMNEMRKYARDRVKKQYNLKTMLAAYEALLR